MKDIKFVCDLTLFDGEDAGGAAAGDTGTDAQGDTKGTSRAATRRGKTGDYANVVFGKQAHTTDAANGDDAGHQTDGQKSGTSDTTPRTLEERRRAFSELVNGEYKDIYTAETQRIIDRRFRDTKELEAQIAKTQPLIDMLMQRYGITDADPEKLQQAVESDNAYWSEAAEEAGMSVEQYKRLQRALMENAATQRKMRDIQGQQRAEAQLRQWYGEAEQMRAKYPGFDLAVESRDPQFLRMLQSGVPVEHAYRVMHMDEIVTEAMQSAAAGAEKRVVDNVRAKGTRPIENGTTAGAAFTVKDDVTKLSKKDRAEAVRRAAQGEIIEF